MKLIILPSAREDLDRGYRFYDRQQRGLGEYFFESLFTEIESLRFNAGIHQKVFGYHRLLSKKFPYAIYYSRNGEVVEIRALLDCRRDPEWIRQRLR